MTGHGTLLTNIHNCCELIGVCKIGYYYINTLEISSIPDSNIQGSQPFDGLRYYNAGIHQHPTPVRMTYNKSDVLRA